MAAHLTDRQRKKIIADRTEGMSYRALAKKYGVSTTAIGNALKSDTETSQKITRKKEENTADILAYMELKKELVCEIIGKGLEALASEDKLASATPSQITTALGTLIDKWTAIGGGPGNTGKEDELSRSLRELGRELESDADQP